MHSAKLRHAGGFVDVRLIQLEGRWLASADTPNGPTLGCGDTSFQALWAALKPFEPVIGELLATLPSWAAAEDGLA